MKRSTAGWLFALVTIFRADAAIPAGARLSLEFTNREFIIGENILLHYVVANTGGPPFTVGVGGDYRGGTRADRFKISATGPDGTALEDPSPVQWNMGGLSPMNSLTNGGRWIESVWLERYLNFTSPGDHTVRVFHDFGWGERPTNDVRERKVTLKIRRPTPDEASEMVRRACAGRFDQYNTWGTQGTPVLDVSVLRHPVFLPGLRERAEAGSQEALRGLNEMRTPEATEALVSLLKVPDKAVPLNSVPAASAVFASPDIPPVALSAARCLERRLPKPPPKYFTSPEEPESLRPWQATWQPRFAAPARAFALFALTSTNRDALLLAATQLGVVGMEEDWGAVTNTLERIVPLTRGPFRADHNYPEPQSACRSLADVAVKLAGERLPTLPRSPAESLVFLVALKSNPQFRPAGWETNCAALLTYPLPFIRAQALASLPPPPPAAIVEMLPALMLDNDSVVARYACVAGQGFKSPAVRSAALQVLAAATNQWLFHAASAAAITNGARAEAATIWANRFGDGIEGPGPDMPHWATVALFDIVSEGHVSGGYGTRLERPEIGRLRLQWMRFIADHRQELAAGETFRPDQNTALRELLAPGWQFYPPR